MNKCLIGGAEDGALVICLLSVICYRACENRLQYIQIYNIFKAHISIEKDLRTAHNQRKRHKDAYFSACQKLVNKPTLFLTVVVIPNSLSATPAF